MSEEHNPIDPERYLVKGKWEVIYQEKKTPQLYRKEIYNFLRPVQFKEIISPGFDIISARQIT